MRYRCFGVLTTALLIGACAGSSPTSTQSSPPARDQRSAAGQDYLRLTTQATTEWKAAAAMACNRRAANEEAWPVMADYFAILASIDQRFVGGVQKIQFPPDAQADASTAIAAYGVRAEDFTKIADEERAQQKPDLTSLRMDGPAATDASRKLRADLGLPVTIQSLIAPCDLSG
jgi:hypothetical protein